MGENTKIPNDQQQQADAEAAAQCLLIFDPDAWAALTVALDGPAKPKPRLTALLCEPSVFDKAEDR